MQLFQTKKKNSSLPTNLYRPFFQTNLQFTIDPKLWCLTQKFVDLTFKHAGLIPDIQGIVIVSIRTDEKAHRSKLRQYIPMGAQMVQQPLFRMVRFLVLEFFTFYDQPQSCSCMAAQCLLSKIQNDFFALLLLRGLWLTTEFDRSSVIDVLDMSDFSGTRSAAYCVLLIK